MKQFFITLVLVVFISAVWFIYQCDKDKQNLQKTLIAKNEDVAALEKEVVALKESLANAEQRARPEPTINSLVDDANSVLRESLGTALEDMQSELDRVKDTLSQELEKLRLDNIRRSDDEAQESERRDGNREDQGTMADSNQKHST